MRDTVYQAVDRALGREAETVVLQMDEEAFRGFYERTSRLLWAYLVRLTGDRTVADDLLQESYYRLLRVQTPLAGDVERRQYLFRIATNLATDRHRRRGVVREETGLLNDELPQDFTQAAADAMVTRVDVTRALGRLRPKDRALLWLAYAQGATHEEIAGAVGVRRASVKVLLSRARRKLLEVLS